MQKGLIQMKLTYERINNANDVISINLHNGYTVVAISGKNPETEKYNTTLYLKDSSTTPENCVQDLKLIEKAECLEFATNEKTINSAILKTVSRFLMDGFFDPYMSRFEYELKCFDRGNELMERERNAH